MKTTPKSKQKPKGDLLVGTWFNSDEIETGVEFMISRLGDSYSVQVRDRFDGEVADVFETAWDGESLSFATHWNSTGRFIRYRLLVLSENRVDVSYTYTDKELYHRQQTKRKK